MVGKIAISLDEDVLDRLNDHLDYGDNRSKWIQKAIVERLDRVQDQKSDE